MINQPLLAITMGDAAGIGPEVTAKALLEESIYSKCRPFVVGNVDAMNDALRIISSQVVANAHSDLSTIKGKYGEIDVLDLNNLNFQEIKYGEISPSCGRASVEWILKAGELAASGAIKAISTAPINKEACNEAGFKDIGHMEIFQRQTKAEDVATMLMARTLRVVHLTTHKSLRVACDYVTKENVLSKIILTNDHLKNGGGKIPVSEWLLLIRTQVMVDFWVTRSLSK